MRRLQELDIAAGVVRAPPLPPPPLQQLTRLSMHVTLAAQHASHLALLTALRRLSLHGAAGVALPREARRALLHVLGALPVLRELRLSRGLDAQLQAALAQQVPAAAELLEGRAVKVTWLRPTPLWPDG